MHQRGIHPPVGVFRTTEGIFVQRATLSILPKAPFAKLQCAG